jgi:hypothetical protein
LQDSVLFSAHAVPILKIFVPQTGQTPWVDGLPFFILTTLAFFISFLARHLTQYACMYTSRF